MEQKQFTHDSESELSVAVVNSFTNPLPLERMKEVFPTETKATAKPARYKPLPWDKERVFSQDPTLCSHWLNLPLNDPLLFTSQVYQQIKAMVDAYQLEHVDAFYEQYSDLLQAVLSEDEKTDMSVFTTNHLRMKHKIYDRRLAHLLYHYYNAMYMLEGALANLCILANVNGPGKFKDFGVACKVSLINTRSNRYEAFPKPKGSENYVTNYTKFAAGKTFNGATFVSIPMWVTDIYGNRGQHAFNFSDAAAGFAATGDSIAMINKFGNDYGTLSELVRNCYETMQLYGMDITRAGGTHLSQLSVELDKDGDKTALPTTPYIENGAQIEFDTTSDKGSGVKRSASFKMNYNGTAFEKAFSYVKDGEGNNVDSDNIISRAWDTFLFWSAYTEKYFASFAMPTSQIHELFMKLGYLEKSKSNVQFFQAINTDMVFDALDLRRDMIYKKNNKANTATIVKWHPIFDVYSVDGGSAYNVDFERNFNRYPVDLDDQFTIIKKAEEYAGLTPTVFHEADDDSGGANESVIPPYVFNACGSGSTLTDAEAGSAPSAGVLGRYASLFDVACSSNVDPSSDIIDTIAIDPEVAKEFIKRNDSIILKERPTSPRIWCQPLIDCSDIYQCGFNVIIASNSETSNEFELWFKDINNYYRGVGGDLNPGLVPAGAGDKKYSHNPCCGVIDISGTKYLTENRVLAPGYLSIVKHALIFVGDGIFYGPQMMGLKLASGTYAEKIAGGVSTFDTAGDMYIDFMQGYMVATGEPTANLPVDETLIPDAISKSIMIAACYADPTYDIPDLEDGYHSMKNDIQNLYYEDDVYPKQILQYVFSPDYGLVLPVTYDVPDTGLLPTMGYEGIEARNRDPSVTFGPRQYVANAVSGTIITAAEQTAGNGVKGLRVKSLMDYDSVSSPSQFLLWFIDKIQFKKLYTIGKQVYCHDAPVKMQAFSSPAKTFLALLQRGQVYWNGVEDTLYLYNIPEEKKHLWNPEWKSIGQIDFGGFIRLPVVKNKTLPSKRLDFKKPHDGDLKTEQANALSGVPEYSGGDSKRKNPKGKRRGKRHHPRNRGTETVNKFARENEFDPSDKKIDDLVDKLSDSKEAKRMDAATSVM